MTQDEVDLIYDYLHAKYHYRDDGIFINKKTNHAWHGFEARNAKQLMYEVSIKINGYKHNMTYSHAVYLYHYKIKPDYVEFVNGNSVDTRIENLRPTSMSNRILSQNDSRFNRHGARGVIKDGNRFVARIMINRKFQRISSHTTVEEASEAYLRAKKAILKK